MPKTAQDEKKPAYYCGKDTRHNVIGVLHMDKKSTFGLNLHQLKELMSIGIDEANFLDEISGSETIAEMLQNQLVTSLSRNSSLLDSLLVIIGKMSYGMESFAGKSLGDLLLNSDTDISLLKAVKTYSKKLSFTMEEGNEKAVAVTMYQAAVASALVHHAQLITTSSYDATEQSLTIMSKKKWMIPEFKDLFLQACDICREKSKE